MRALLLGLSLPSLLILMSSHILHGQDRLSYGFKAGLNSSKLNGTVENGRYESSAGFHLGVIFQYAITDLFGVKGEFMYSQKGGDFFYDGPSFFHLQDETSNILATGTRKMNVSISNDYLDFPFLAYGRLGPLEISGGINIGLLVGSSGVGQMKFSGTEPQFDEFTINLNHSYYADKAGEATSEEEEIVRIGATQVSLPSEIGAYYEYDEKNASLFRFIDVGLNAGASFYVNDGLYLGVRANYGLTDVTKQDAEVVYHTFAGNAPASGSVNNKQISYQFSIGFSF